MYDYFPNESYKFKSNSVCPSLVTLLWLNSCTEIGSGDSLGRTLATLYRDKSCGQKLCKTQLVLATYS